MSEALGPVSRTSEASGKAAVVNIYGCGGMGSNIAKEYQNFGSKEVQGVALLTPYLIDTADSNLSSKEDAAISFIIPKIDDTEGDGSAKVRRENAEAIERYVPNILKKFEPSDVNIVVFSAGGGSGSVIGPVIARELLKRGKSVVVIAVGIYESGITALNTLSTLKSLDGVVGVTNRPVIVSYESQTRKTKQSDIDANIHATIGSLAILASGQNYGLDKADLRAFLDFTIPLKAVKPQLALLHTYTSHEDFDNDLDNPIALAAIIHSKDDQQPEKFVPYNTDGIFQASKALTTPLFFGIDTTKLTTIRGELHALTKQADDVRDNLGKRVDFLPEDGEVPANGMVYD